MRDDVNYIQDGRDSCSFLTTNVSGDLDTIHNYIPHSSFLWKKLEDYVSFLIDSNLEDRRPKVFLISNHFFGNEHTRSILRILQTIEERPPYFFINEKHKIRFLSCTGNEIDF